MAVPPVSELEQICGGEGRDPSRQRDFRLRYAEIVRKLSIRFTWLLLHTRLSANQVTLGAVLIGCAGGLLLAWSEFWPLVAGLVLMQLSFVLDFSDGEVARYRAKVEGRQTNAGGAYLDWIGHYYVPAIVIAALAYGAFHENGEQWLLLAALVVIFSFVRIAYSARDHVLIGLYRDREQLRGSDEFLRATLARQGGDPQRLDLEANLETRRAGGRGSGALWKRYTNAGQFLVFPGFVNLVTLAVLIDVIWSSIDGTYPQVAQTTARSVLVGGLGVVHLVHQVRAAAQGFEVLRRL